MQVNTTEVHGCNSSVVSKRYWSIEFLETTGSFWPSLLYYFMILSGRRHDTDGLFKDENSTVNKCQTPCMEMLQSVHVIIDAKKYSLCLWPGFLYLTVYLLFVGLVFHGVTDFLDVLCLDYLDLTFYWRLSISSILSSVPEMLSCSL